MIQKRLKNGQKYDEMRITMLEKMHENAIKNGQRQVTSKQNNCVNTKNFTSDSKEKQWEKKTDIGKKEIELDSINVYQK